MRFFLETTKKEILFILNELWLLCSHFSTRVSKSLEAFNRNTSKFFKPELDAQGLPVKEACIDVFKRAIFKLAAVFERVHVFTEGTVRARSINLEIIKSELTDTA